MSFKLIVLGASGARDAIKNTPVGHISSHANAQLMRSDPDRLHEGSIFHDFDVITNPIGANPI